MEQFLMNTLMFVLAAVALISAWIGVSASRRMETVDAKIDAKVAQQAVLNRIAAQTASRGEMTGSEQHQTV